MQAYNWNTISYMGQQQTRNCLDIVKLLSNVLLSLTFDIYLEYLLTTSSYHKTAHWLGTQNLEYAILNKLVYAHMVGQNYRHALIHSVSKLFR